MSLKLNRILVLVIISIIFSFNVNGDGCFLPPVYYDEDIHEPSQKAMIVHDGNTEKLIIQATYEGKMDNFAWIIPTSSYPKTEKAHWLIFEELHFLTEPEYKRAPNFYFGGRMLSKSMELSDVIVHEQKQVGIYEISILSSTNPTELIDWLNQNKYRVSTKAESVLKYYIDMGWFFIAQRINLDPFDATVLDSLREINPSIVDREDAIAKLTEDIVGYIESGVDYNRLKNVYSVKIDYGEEEVEGYDRYNERGQKPEYLITKSDYDRIYEQYNGYFEDHIKLDLSNALLQAFREEYKVPYRHQCEMQNMPNQDYTYCDVWYFAKDSEEYDLLKNAECGKYCSLISSEKEKFTAEDLSKVAANAILEGEDEKVRSHFSIIVERENWYDNKEDIFNRISDDIERTLRSRISSNVAALENQLANELIDKYSKKNGVNFNDLNDVAFYYRDRVLDSFKDSSDPISDYVITFSDYQNFKSYYEGDHDKLKLRKNVEEKVKHVVNWKQETTKRKLGEGRVQPILIEFNTKDIIYPLKISSINKGASEILLYVFAKHRTKVDTIEGFEVEFAKWIETEDIKTNTYFDFIERLSHYEKMQPYEYFNPRVYYYLNQILDDRYFLTKFRKEMWPKEMTDDLIIVKERNNNEYRLKVYEKGYVVGWIISIFFLIFFWFVQFGVVHSLGKLYNKVTKKKQDSVFYITKIRSFWYSFIVPIILYFATFNNAIGEVTRDILEGYFDIFEFIFNIFNFLGLPKVLNRFIMIVFGIVVFYLLIHLVGSLLVKVSKIFSDKSKN